MSQPTSNHPGKWTLECVDIACETHDVKSFYLRVRSNEDDLVPVWPYKPGQFVTLMLWLEEKLVPRSYTLSSSPTRPSLVSLTIKRDPQGLVSRFMYDKLTIGDRLSARGPGGSFDLHSVAPRRKIMMLTGGAGITPAMSMLRYLCDIRSDKHEVTFLHSARTPEDMIFREETLLLAKQHNIHVQYVCAHHAEPDMESGFLSRQIFERNVEDIHEYTVLPCGPAPYMDAVKSILREMDFDMRHYHEESFGDLSQRTNPQNASPETLTTRNISIADKIKRRSETIQSKGHTTQQPDTETNSTDNNIHFSASDTTVAYSPGETLLQIATRAGIAVPTNCQMGLCGTCKAKCLSGTVEMELADGLTSEEINGGCVLTCIGKPNGSVSIEL
ncbi:hybrid-cluster NAD(P)-dependent oxidoreductase [Veronia nyctiphanis]|uniref:Hybrid-cluster NAD(P)-dependent oxidoreductase n=1 Tax=Veronia nyctiphanis TaxID=1278244 RepID=A0A4Q0YQ90_9GAMM|nr:hybrid-cluster NAD(P)-dependent oxidoreductase [Veronia nyctiphanis]RXJ72763.1 hybrid-cluster NAD(P)-dependent oxidoreductase [Veronia nyctiphanis]